MGILSGAFEKGSPGISDVKDMGSTHLAFSRQSDIVNSGFIHSFAENLTFRGQNQFLPNRRDETVDSPRRRDFPQVLNRPLNSLQKVQGIGLRNGIADIAT
ncbi:hypothetical protein AB4072_04485 [Microvirga sp. 2MCAF38]|uniref:hypothetical protein n=1 Tax=Microvirga sp. 2MCAF38 TaxID=3232989 RepID=UPI003F97D011